MTKKDNKSTKWNPVRKGVIYCSPNCGGGCTHNSYKRACRESEALAESLGKGWTPEVWENLGVVLAGQ